MTKQESFTDEDKVVIETRIAAPPERVFQALTDEKQLRQWWTNEEAPLLSYEIEPRLGGHYRYVARPGTMKIGGLSEFECHGEITAFDPPKVLEYTWIANWHEDKTFPTRVRYELTAEGSSTRIKVTHSRLANEDANRKGYGNGWVGVLKLLKTFVEGNEAKAL